MDSQHVFCTACVGTFILQRNSHANAKKLPANYQFMVEEYIKEKMKKQVLAMMTGQPLKYMEVRNCEEKTADQMSIEFEIGNTHKEVRYREHEWAFYIKATDPEV